MSNHWDDIPYYPGTLVRKQLATTLDEESVGELDRLVKEQVFQSRSQAIQEAVSEKLLRMKRTRLAVECDKLEPVFEKALAEEGMTVDMSQWPGY